MNGLVIMQFEWNEHKNKINKQKHGISFEAASLVFQTDPYIISVLDRCFEELEERWYSIGQIEDITIFVAHTT